MKKLLLPLIICITCSFALSAQTAQIFTENFETYPANTSFTLNGAGPGVSTGNNRWIIDSVYSGAPTYPNTMSEDSTYSGNITNAPHSKYLHIYDAASGIQNANYDATNQSDNFTYLTGGLCTLGETDVHFIFFYLCQGSSNAYGEVYYSINGGPWVQTGQAQYNNKYKWQYEDITDPVWSNQNNVRFGFRWVNNSGTPPSNESFSIDDIDVVATYGSSTGNPITITVDSVVPNPVCQGTYLFIYYHLSDTLCDGSYTIYLSTSTGTFPGPNGWITNMYYPQTNGLVVIQLPNPTNNVPPGTCYKIRIDRTSPAPLITGIASGCFTIQTCPNSITTLQPVVTYHPNDTLCVGSAIDVPFYSYGIFTFNTYTAQLSDSLGNFPLNPTVINSTFNSQTYDPNLPPYQPGTVSGLVPVVSPGCNYYVRVVSSNGVAIGSPWGPFCIKQCDIQTNQERDLHFCVTDCSASPLGIDSMIHVGLHTFNSNAVYNSGNVFTTQLMSSMTFNQIGNNGILGSVASTHDTLLDLHVPCKDSLPIYGIPTGMNYMRVIATNSSTPQDTLGSLIRVTIGATHAVGPTVSVMDYATFTVKDTFCTGEGVYPFFSPYNYFDMSNYTWVIGGTNGGYNGGNPFTNSQGANSNNTGFVFNFVPGTYTAKVRETNNGCVGPWGPTLTFYVIGPPNVTISGPILLCQGDTIQYSIPNQTLITYSTWSSSNNFVDTLYNKTNTHTESWARNTGTFIIKIVSENLCGFDSSQRTVQVKPYPIVHASNDTTICASQPVTLSTQSGQFYTFNWTNGGNTVGTNNSVQVTPTATTKYIITVTSPGGCKRKDSVLVNVQTPSDKELIDSLCPNGAIPLQLSADSTGTYLWSNGSSSQQISVNDTGTYSVSINMPGRACARVLTYKIKAEPCPQPLTLPNVFTPEGNGTNDYFHAITTGNYAKFYIKIYDRWGLLMYESTDPFFMWDGNNKHGRPCPDGVYYYIGYWAQAVNDETTSFKGFITLIR